MVNPRLDFLFFDAGGGHRAAATALEAQIQREHRPWDVRLVDLNDVLVKTDILKNITGYGLEDIYNIILQRGWTLGSAQMLPVMQFAIRCFHSQQVRLMEEYWRGNTPDLVVSIVPNFNRALFQALRRVSASTPYASLLTDFADYPPHFWIERDQAQYFICGTTKAVAQAKQLGHPSERIFATSGMILRPSFYDIPPIDRQAERAKLGLAPNIPTGIVLFGGHGAPVMADIVNRLQPLAGRMQLILLCGHNDNLATRLRAVKGALKLHVEGFTREVPCFMQMADFMIGKPGPGSVSEAIHMGLPVIVERNNWTLPQERYNADWLTENQLGLVLPSFRQVDQAVNELLRPGVLENYRLTASGVHNRAIFEIPEILEKLLAVPEPTNGVNRQYEAPRTTT